MTGRKRDRDGIIWYDAAQFRAVTPLTADEAPAAVAKGMVTVSFVIEEGPPSIPAAECEALLLAHPCSMKSGCTCLGFAGELCQSAIQPGIDVVMTTAEDSRQDYGTEWLMISSGGVLRHCIHIFA